MGCGASSAARLCADDGSVTLVTAAQRLLLAHCNTQLRALHPDNGSLVVPFLFRKKETTAEVRRVTDGFCVMVQHPSKSQGTITGHFVIPYSDVVNARPNSPLKSVCRP